MGKARNSTGIFVIITALIAVIMFAVPIFAEDTDSSKTLMQRIHDLEEKMKDYEDARKKGEETSAEVDQLKGKIEDLENIKKALGLIRLSGGVTAVVQGTTNNEDNSTEGNSTDAAFTLDLNVDTHFEDYGDLHVHFEGGDGEGLNNENVSFSSPNYDAYATKNHENKCGLTISEAFYELNFMDEKAVFDIGKMDISVLFDENEVAGDETTQFLSNIFVKSMGLTIPEPDNFYCPAVTLKVAPKDLYEFRIVGASVEGEDHAYPDDNWEDIFSHGFIAGQITLKAKIGGKKGNYRFYGWWDDRRYLKNDHLATEQYKKGSSFTDYRKGWGISFDQEIGEGVKGFIRYSQTDDDLASWGGSSTGWEILPYDSLWSLGVELTGPIGDREKDTLGIAYGQIFLTGDYKAANVDSDDETYVEAYYRVPLHERFALSGDFQWINNSYGHSWAKDVYIFGLRAQLDF